MFLRQPRSTKCSYGLAISTRTFATGSLASTPNPICGRQPPPPASTVKSSTCSLAHRAHFSRWSWRRRRPRFVTPAPRRDSERLVSLSFPSSGPRYGYSTRRLVSWRHGNAAVAILMMTVSAISRCDWFGSGQGDDDERGNFLGGKNPWPQ
eukprot:scaffold2363_cov159-Amphora_coffeaeformis.AAC.17